MVDNLILIDKDREEEKNQEKSFKLSELILLIIFIDFGINESLFTLVDLSR